MYIIHLFIALLFVAQGGHKIEIEDVRRGDSFEQGQSTYHTFGKISIEPFDIKDRDAYVLLVSNSNSKLTFHEYEKFALSDVNRTTFNWSYSFNIDTPQDDFNVYAILTDKFSKNLFETFEKEVSGMNSIEQLIGKLRETGRIDPLNFTIFWVRIN